MRIGNTQLEKWNKEEAINGPGPCITCQHFDENSLTGAGVDTPFMKFRCSRFTYDDEVFIDRDKTVRYAENFYIKRAISPELSVEYEFTHYRRLDECVRWEGN